ncbi:hypothetical protein AVEN_125106-1 [Araneus ventricosus]|uniref:Uncharacterized protein n=1 Tax=Araneus ventricosus TaxID=182803 RepID=A0A4Y2IDY2_ARAVE|nr:hypothetical protein AVEN_125106-1 [Araneus ventricosus]
MALPSPVTSENQAAENRKDDDAQLESNFRTDLVILNRGQITETSPDPQLHSKPPSNTSGRHFSSTDLTCVISAYKAVLLWNRVSSLEPSSTQAKTLPPNHLGPRFS